MKKILTKEHLHPNTRVYPEMDVFYPNGTARCECGIKVKIDVLGRAFEYELKGRK